MSVALQYLETVVRLLDSNIHSSAGWTVQSKQPLMACLIS